VALHLISPGSGDVELLFEQVLGADTATIDTGATISGGFSDLRVVILARTAQAAASSALFLRFNNDSGANYDDEFIQVSQATVVGSATAGSTSVNIIIVPGTSGAASSFGVWEIFIPQYAATVVHKTGSAIGGFADSTIANSRHRTCTFRWRSTAAINRVSIVANDASNLITGTTLRVYGLR
jgi:hypothetical protein